MSRLLNSSLALGSAALVSLTPGLVAAEEDSRGVVSLSYQYIKVDGFESSIGKLDIGTTDTHTLFLEVDYELTDRVSVSVGIPFVTKRYQGDFPHLPDGIVPPKNDPLIDDGSYHTEFQDFTFGVSYLLTTSPVVVEPFIVYGVPSNGYPHYGHAAVGQNLWHVQVGSSFTYFPPFSDFYYQFAPSYTFVEETLGESIDHWRLRAEVGYLFRPGFSGRIFALVKEGDGLKFPDDFPPPRNDEFWFQHDRTIKHNYVNIGVGVDWGFSDRSQLSLSAMTMVDEDQVHVMDYAFTVGMSRSF